MTPHSLLSRRPRGHCCVLPRPARVDRLRPLLRHPRQRRPDHLRPALLAGAGRPGRAATAAWTTRCTCATGTSWRALVAGQDYSTGTSVEHCAAPCLGLSYQSDQQVTELILTKLPASLSLVVRRDGAVAGPRRRHRRALGLAARPAHRARADRRSPSPAPRTPVFVIGLLLMIVVCGELQLLPFPQYVPLTDDPEQWAWNLLLPWLTLALVEAASLTPG